MMYWPKYCMTIDNIMITETLMIVFFIKVSEVKKSSLS